MEKSLYHGVLFLLIAAAPAIRAAEPDSSQAIRPDLTYHADIRPLLQKHCLDCHGADQADADFRVDSYQLLLQGGVEAGPAVTPGKADESPLVQYLTGKRTPRMPKQRKALADAEVGLIRAWIDQGAPAGEPQQEVSFSEEQIVFFETSIRPLLAQHCMNCHGTDKANGNLAFLARQDLLQGGTLGPAIVPGQPDESLLIAAVRQTGKLRMPKNKPPLDDESIALLEKWIAMDAPWPATSLTDPPKIRTKFVVYDSDREHWAFQPVVRPELPAVAHPAWPRDDLDRFILARLESEQLTPAPPTARRTLMRRVSFDLTGLPPSLEDLNEYLSPTSDAPPERYVDKLLDSQEFGVHWARHWLDHVRYRPYPKKSEADDPYRQWVIDAFNEDMPYDQFLKMQIAGDLLPADKPDEVHLDGLIAVRPWSLKSRHEDQIDLLGRTFMGLSLFCARCHDHKLEPISRDDYYAIQGIFESSRVVQTPFLKERAKFDDYMAGLARTQANEARMKKELKQYSSLASLVDLRARIETERKKLDDPAQDMAKVQANLEKLQGEETTRLAEIQQQKKIAIDAPEAIEYMQLRRENSDFAEKWKEVFQLDALVDQSESDKIADAAPPRLGVESKSGEPAPADAPVPRRFPTILAGFDQTPLGEQTQQSGRVELAEWLADARHPITARLMTNRIWYYLLGEGLVPSLSNFGRSGDAPSHPELLDYLSHNFVEQNWSMKQLIRKIVLSATYQQTSKLEVSPDEQAQRLRWFGVARRKRLEVESIYRTLNLLELDPAASERRRDPPVDLTNEMRLLFDGASSDLIVPRRTSSASPLQALFLMNSEHIQASTERFAVRLCQSPDDSQQIGQAFLLLYGREVTPPELHAGESFLAAWQADPSDSPDEKRKNDEVPPAELSKWRAYLQVLLLTNEFLYVD
ncbi:PSD1 and planctomycete cytochrome C domain-containing protein [Lignipirellula cremea]|nr:PSD1 and planctomycete cytochrome C domain-containing protein [Lignipirellula cremea]